MNAYFQILNNNGIAAIKFFPPTDGGAGINREELMEYLSIKNIEYDVKEMVNTIVSLDKEVVFPTKTEYKYNEGEYVKVHIAPDNMSVTVRMIPPFAGGEQMSRDEFMRELSSRGVIAGIDDAAIDEFLNKRPYCTDTVVARGSEPIQGSDAVIEYFFNTDPRVKPTLNEDGTVDFFNLNTINHCLKGDLLAKLTPAVQGQNGVNVKGERTRPRDVKPLMLKFGNNIDVNEDKTELRSQVNGHVALVEGKVFVSNVLEVENVDNSVGNIEYDGAVRVNGNVCENFSVKAKGTIEVRGIVEGAFLESDENIIIARGMAGMHKGVIKAKGNIIAKFIENAKVSADGYVESESILHSEVIAGTEIKVTGKKGFISGGRVCASQCIEVKTLGSNMGTDTIVEVGMDATIKQEIQSLQKEITDINKNLKTIRPVLEGAKQKLQAGIKLSTDQLIQIQKLAKTNKEQTERLAVCMEALNKYQAAGDAETQGTVTVTGDVYPGVKICIGDVSMAVKSSMKYCRFIKEAGDVKMVAIY